MPTLWIIIKEATCKPVLECWDYELQGLVLKSDYIGLPTKDWLYAFNRAVKKANGNQPSVAQIKAELPF